VIFEFQLFPSNFKEIRVIRIEILETGDGYVQPGRSASLWRCILLQLPSEPAQLTKSERDGQQQLLLRIRRDARTLARAFRLPLRSVAAERPQVKRRYGICYDDGSIRVRLRHVRTGRLLKYSALIDTLCHELAHLEHFDHGVRFKAFYRDILGYARRCGIYRPAPSRPGPRSRPSSPSEAIRLRGSSIMPLARVPGPAESEPEEAPPAHPASETAEPIQLDLFSAGSARR